MDNSRRFVPAFLKNIDRQLLLNKPSVWSAGTHLVLYFGLLFSVILTVFCMLIFADAKDYSSSVWTITGFVSLLSGVGLIFWLIYLLRFNVFKRYGNWQNGDGIRTFLLFFLNILIIVAIPFIPSATETFMANRQFSDTEIINDINEINLAVNNLEYDQIPKKWDADSSNIVKQPYTIENRDTIWETNTQVVSADTVIVRSTIYDRDLPGRLISADSVLKINDSLYVFYKVRLYTYSRSYQTDDIKGANLLTDKDIYYAVVKDHKAPDVVKLNKRIEVLQKKYRGGGYSGYYDYDEPSASTQPPTYDEYIKRKYKIPETNNTMSTVLGKKHRWKEEWEWILHFMFYATLILTMLIFIFRHTTVKTFFMSILAGVILAVITGLFIAVGRMEETGIFTTLTVYFFVFALLGISTQTAKTRTLFQGIGLNFFLFSLPFMPLLWLAFYYNSNDVYKPGYSIDYAARSMNYFYAEVIGFVILLILIEPVFKKLYRAWYAAPEE